MSMNLGFFLGGWKFRFGLGLVNPIGSGNGSWGFGEMAKVEGSVW